ncbi:MAG: hypothetical protein NVSMB9_23820 [Isosphaeraceae bacterium]
MRSQLRVWGLLTTFALTLFAYGCAENNEATGLKGDGSTKVETKGEPPKSQADLAKQYQQTGGPYKEAGYPGSKKK